LPEFVFKERLSRDGDIFLGWEGNPFDSGRLMVDGFRGKKVGFGFNLTAQKILAQGRLTRGQRQDIIGGTSFSGAVGYDVILAGQVSPTDKGNYYSAGLGVGAGFNFGLGGGQSTNRVFGKSLSLPIQWGAEPPQEIGKCECSK
jgi:hypothetical protein